ncbi:MBL fold metallo-hydrolase [Geoglobus ahangari]
MMQVHRLGDVERVGIGTEIGGRVLLTASFYVYSDIVFDSGCSNVRGEVAEWLKERGFEAVYLTHHHEDHSGNAALFDEICAGDKTAEILASGLEIPDYRKAVWGDVERVPASKFRKPDVEHIHTPGHSEDHVVYFADGYAFIGDLVPARRVFVALRGENFARIIESLERVLERDFEVAFGGHGIYSREEVEEYLSYLKEKRAKCVEFYEMGESWMEIYRKVFGEPGEKAMMFEAVSGGEWSRKNLIRAMVGVDGHEGYSGLEESSEGCRS